MKIYIDEGERMWCSYIKHIALRKEVIGEMPQIGTTELLVLALLVVFLFGGKKFPQLAKGIADSIREFKKATKEE